uniref:Secreted protein n=1 Tax=Rhizophora mucronata TaxID=61149 RepID=A0A2P2MNH9_RHIMU
MNNTVKFVSSLISILVPLLVQDFKGQSCTFLSDELEFCVNFNHFCLFFSAAFTFCENFVSPCLSAPRLTPFPTRMLVTPIFETYHFE